MKKIVRCFEFLDRFQIPRGTLFVILLLMLVASLGEAATAGLIIPFLNSLQNVADPGQSNAVLKFIYGFFSQVPEDRRMVYVLVTLAAVVTGVQILNVFLARVTWKFVVIRIQYNVAERLFSDIISANIKFFYKQRSGTLINHITENVNLSFNCIYHLLKMVHPFLFFLAYLIMGFLILPVYTLVLVALITTLGLGFRKLVPYFVALGVRSRKMQEASNNIIVETIQGVRSIMLSNAHRQHHRKFQDVAMNFYMARFKSGWLITVLPILVRCFSLVIIVLILLFNMERLATQGPEFLSQMFFFVFVAGNIFINLGKVNSMYSSYAYCYAGMNAILELDDQLQGYRQTEKEGAVQISRFEESITGRELCFRYEEEANVLKYLNFQIPVGRKVAFVGASGSGKSTLVDLISGFYDDYEGDLQVDGRAMRDISKSCWRSLIGYVSQETFLFNDTVRMNLTFGFDQTFTDEELWQALDLALLSDAVRGFPQGLETELGERGVRLSGGEKQRLAIARLFLKNPPIILLDEATSALDSESEKGVKRALDSLSRERTVIAVAHRLSTISDFDHIYVLDQGRIVESGTHDELIALRQFYYRYYTIQSMEGAMSENEQFETKAH